MAYTKTTYVNGENKYDITDQAGNVIQSDENLKALQRQGERQAKQI